MQLHHAFEPLKLRHKTLRNRFVFGAHTTNMSKDGLPDNQHLGYYLERAKGGAAMIVVEPMPVNHAAVLTRGNFRPKSDDVIEPLSKITKACKAEGAVILQQLYHVGAHGDWDNSWQANLSPSGNTSYHDNDGSRQMSVDEIEQTIDDFVQAAIRCKKSGFDGVEVWAAYNCLLDQFWTPFSNQRTDEWGGSLENRTRFSREIMRRIRHACGDQFIIGLSISDDPSTGVFPSRDSMVEIVKLHDTEGLMDYVTVGAGSYMDFQKIIPSFQYPENLGADLAERLKNEHLNAKVTAEANIRTPENANTIIGAKRADLVSLVRGQIADPHLVNKAAENRMDDIRGCLSCNQQCWGRRGRDYYISCLINPSVGHEFQWGGDRFTTAENKKTVLVVGGGPAGLEAARVAAERGHKVTLVEACPVLGGQFRLAGLQPRRAQIIDLLDWYERQLNKLGVDLRFNTYWDDIDIVEFGADTVLLATGSLPSETGFQKALPQFSELPGLNTGNIWSTEDVMGRAAKLDHKIIILDEGGHWKGIGTAWHLAEAGHEVTIVTPDAMIARDLFRSATDFNARKTLAKLGVHFVTETVITQWSSQGARCVSLLTDEEIHIAAGSLVLATGNRSDTALLDALRNRAIEVLPIGDAAAPRLAAAAIYDGRLAGLSV